MTTFTLRAAHALLQNVLTRRPEDWIKDADPNQIFCFDYC